MRRLSLPESKPSRIARITGMLGLPDIRGHVLLVIALIVNSIGIGLAGPLILLYLTTVAGLPVATAGLLLTGSGVVSLAVPAITAVVSNRYGAKATVIIGQVLQGSGMAGLLLATTPAGKSLPVLVACCLLLSVGQRTFWSSVFALIADAADSSGTEDSKESWFALSGMTQGVGFALGALCAGALLIMPGQTPYLIAIAANAVSFVASAILLSRDPGHPKAAAEEHDEGSKGQVHRDGPYLLLIGANTLFAFCSTILGIGLPLYIVQGLEAPAWLIGPLLAMNTLLGATCQGLAVRATRRFRRIRVLVVAGLIWAVWGVVTAALGWAPLWLVLPGLVIAVLTYSIAELIHAPVSMGLASDAAPKASRAGYLSWFQYSFALATIAAPGTFAISFAVAPSLPWLLTSGLGLLGCVGIVAAGRGLTPRLQN